MPEICRFYGIIIAMFYDDHDQPHFHARDGSDKVSIDIRSLSVLAGKFPPRALGLVTEWAILHQNELLDDWGLARERRTLKRIDPLS